MKKTDSEELVKTKPMNNVTFTTSVFGPDGNPVSLVDAETFETLDISTIKRKIIISILFCKSIAIFNYVFF